jgi:hypothetical protein
MWETKNAKTYQKNENSTPSSAFSFFLSESEEESCRGVAEAAAAANGGQDKEKATREWGSCMR